MGSASTTEGCRMTQYSDATLLTWLATKPDQLGPNPNRPGPTHRTPQWTRSSAICTAFSAAPLRRLSLLTNSTRPRPPSTDESWRTRPT